MCNAGPSASSGNVDGEDNKTQKKEQVSCIVKFRPGNGWRDGMFGFDWIREANEERGISDGKNGKPSDDEGLYPMEYAYAKNVNSITYARFKKTKTWYVKHIVYPDMCNGDCFYEKNGITLNNADQYRKHPNESIQLKDFCAYPLNKCVVLDNKTHLSINEKNEWYKILDDSKGKLIDKKVYIRIKDSIIDGSFTLSYWQNKNLLWITFEVKAKLAGLDFFNGSFKYNSSGVFQKKKGEKWIDVDSQGFDDYRKIIEKYNQVIDMLAKYSGIAKDNILNNKKMYIEDLVKLSTLSESVDNIEETYNKPSMTRWVALDIEKSNEGETWDGFRVFSWKELYENSFNQLGIYLNDKDEVYCVPVLSFGLAQAVKKRFNSETDIELRTAEVNLHIGGSCRKLVLKSSDAEIKIDKKEFKNIDSKSNITLTIKNTSNEPKKAFISAEADGKLAGQLEVMVNGGKLLKAGLVLFGYYNEKHNDLYGTREVRSYADGRVFRDHINILTNCLLQAGIECEYSQFFVDINSSFVITEKDQEDFNRDVEELKQLYSPVVLNIKCAPQEANCVQGHIHTNKWLFSNKYKEALAFFTNKLFSSTMVDASDTEEIIQTKNQELKRIKEQNVLIFLVDGEFDSNTLGYQINVHTFDHTVPAIVIAKNKPFVLVHEILHAFGISHNFQSIARTPSTLKITKKSDGTNNYEESDGSITTNEFCFPFRHTSNVMDYYTRTYSLHKYQWKKMYDSKILSTTGLPKKNVKAKSNNSKKKPRKDNNGKN